jgi:hypothetical protein
MFVFDEFKFSQSGIACSLCGDYTGITFRFIPLIFSALIYKIPVRFDLFFPIPPSDWIG